MEVSAGEILGQPDDHVVIHGHVHPLAQRPLPLACAPAVRNIATLSVQPLNWAIFIEQADGNAQSGDAPVADKLLGRIMSSVATPRRRYGPATAIW